MLAASACIAAQPEIIEAVKTANHSRVVSLAKENGNINSRDEQGNTPLIVAALYSSPQMVRLLTDHGAEINATNNDGATALLYGSYDPEKTRILLGKGADVNARSKRGNTALMLASRVFGNAKSVELLLQKGAQVNATNVFGATALMCAAASEDKRTMRLLLKHGAKVNSPLAPGQAGAIWGGGRTPLMWAAFRGDLAALDLFLKHGADVNVIDGLGTPLTQAAWAERTEAVRALLKAGAKIDLFHPLDEYTALHWAASSESGNPELVNLLLKHGAKVNARGGEPVGAFMGTLYTPLMLAQKRGETEIVAALLKAGGTGEKEPTKEIAPEKQLPDKLTIQTLRDALSQALTPLETTALKSRPEFLQHSSKQNCLSCHQQYLPAAALGFAKKSGVSGDAAALQELLRMMKHEDDTPSGFAEATFHPEPLHSFGYNLLGLAANSVAGGSVLDPLVHHLAVIQGPEGNWYNNLPRPPLQSSDVSATALAVHALTAFPLPARKAEMDARVERARKWLWKVEPVNTEEFVYKLLGLHWAGESPKRLQKAADQLLARQRADGGWAQLPKLGTDAYATGQALFALHHAGIRPQNPQFEKGLRFLLSRQRADGTWFAARRAFPFQPTMKNWFSHGRDGWLSAAASSWAVMALAVSLPDFEPPLAVNTP